MSRTALPVAVLFLTTILAGCAADSDASDEPLLDEPDESIETGGETITPINEPDEPVGNNTAPKPGDAPGETSNETVEAPLPPLVVNAGGPYAGQALIPIPLAANATRDADLANVTCAWSGSGATFTGANSCNARVSWPAAGSYAVTVEVTEGEETANATVAVTVSAPAPAGKVVGSMNSYNGGAIGLSGSVGGIADRPAPHLAGEPVGIQSRFTQSSDMNLTASTAVFYVLDESMTPVVGPLDARSAEDCPTTGCNGWLYAISWDIPQTFPGGVYYPAFLVDDGEQMDWAIDEDLGGFYPIEIIGA